MGILSDGPRGYFIYSDVAIIPLAIVANCVIFYALCQRKFCPNSYRILLINLSICDLYITSINLLSVVYQIVYYTSPPPAIEDEAKEQNIDASSPSITGNPYFQCAAHALRTLQLAGLFANLFNLCAMSIDHFLGVKFPVEYRDSTRNKVSGALIASTWLISFTLAFADIPVNLILYYESDFTSEKNGHPRDQPIMPSQYKLFGNFSKFHKFGSKSSPLAATTRTILTTPPELDPPESPVFVSSPNDYQPGGLLTHFVSVLVDAYTTNNGSNSYDDNWPAFQSPSKQSGNNNVVKGFIDNALQPGREPVNMDEPQTGGDFSQFCTFFSVKKFWFELTVIAMVAVCFVLLIACYGAIYQRVISRASDSTGRRTKRLVLTTVTFIAAFVICWIPFVCFEFLLFILSSNRSPIDWPSETASIFLVQRILYSLLVAYPLLDPVIYACRVPTVNEFLFGQCAKHVLCCRRMVTSKSDPNFTRRTTIMDDRGAKTSSKALLANCSDEKI